MLNFMPIAYILQVKTNSYSSLILNQIPNATCNTFLNISKPTECRLIPSQPWLDKCVGHSVSSLNDLNDFMHAHWLFVSLYPLSKKSQKRRQKITFFNFVLLYAFFFFFFFFFLWAFYDFKVDKSIKIEQNLL